MTLSGIYSTQQYKLCLLMGITYCKTPLSKQSGSQSRVVLIMSNIPLYLHLLLNSGPWDMKFNTVWEECNWVTDHESWMDAFVAHAGIFTQSHCTDHSQTLHCTPLKRLLQCAQDLVVQHPSQQLQVQNIRISYYNV